MSGGLPEEISEKVGLNLSEGRDCGAFTPEQRRFLEYHRDCVFEQRNFQDRLTYERCDLPNQAQSASIERTHIGKAETVIATLILPR